MTFTQLAGVIPALVFPTATAAQFLSIVKARSAKGVNLMVWLLFGAANLAMYIYAERYTEWQAIVGLLFTAALDFAIVVAAMILNAAERRRSGGSAA